VVCLLLMTAGCATVESDWKSARKEGTADAYGDFLKKYPSSELADSARQRWWQTTFGTLHAMSVDLSQVKEYLTPVDIERADKVMKRHLKRHGYVPDIESPVRIMPQVFSSQLVMSEPDYSSGWGSDWKPTSVLVSTSFHVVIIPGDSSFASISSSFGKAEPVSLAIENGQIQDEGLLHRMITQNLRAQIQTDTFEEALETCLSHLDQTFGRSPQIEAEIPAEKAFTLALKFNPQESTTYRLARENDRSVEWEGTEESKPKGFTGGHTGKRMEMTFTQTIRSVDDQGNAIADITIQSLKYITRVKSNVTLDFDSSSRKDPNNPLGKLIGQSYTIELTPSGDVSKVMDVGGARSAVEGSTSGHRMATNLLSEKAIKDRHAISALPDANESTVHLGESWSRIKSLSFDLMGAKSYEKIYTLEEVRDINNRRIALARMDAVPSAEEAKELHKEQATSPFSQMFDNTERFTGELKLDLTSGNVWECREEMLIEWFIVDPNPEDDERPAALRMTAARLAGIERID